MRKIIWRYYFIVLLVLTIINAKAQIAVNTVVVPPYQSRIAEYASNPQLMLITLTNTSTVTQNVQLTGNITGNNGIAAWVKPGYRSPNPIVIAPGQTVNLNGNDIAFLFDINKIEYTGISRSDMTRGLGLLEGTYTLCIRALDHSSLQPISSEQSGCSEIRIADIEPPRILSPIQDQVVESAGAQAFPITWSTPAGSAPNTQYKVKIIEMIASRNPNDALQSSRPLVEETVAQNMLIYGPSHPTLIPGRQYVVVVQAEDPTGKTLFRNKGLSEVHVFTYGTTTKVNSISTPQKNIATNDQLSVKYATNQINGKLVWAFKKSEEPNKSLVNYSLQSTGKSLLSINEQKLSVSSISLSNTYLSHSPLQLINSTANAQADPTLNNQKGLVTTNNDNAIVYNSAELISSTGASNLSHEIQTVNLDSGTNRYPLENVRVTLKGIVNPLNDIVLLGSNPNKMPVTVKEDVQWSGLRIIENGSVGGSNSSKNIILPQNGIAPSTVLATGRSDIEGNFTLQYVDPKYEGTNKYSKLVLSVEADGFEPLEYPISLSKVAENVSLDIGELLLLAKTYRLNPTINFEEIQDGRLTNPGMRMVILRPKEDLTKFSFLKQEGGLNVSSTQDIIRNGKQYVVVAKDSIMSSDNPISSLNFTFGRLFYVGNLLIEFEPIQPIYKPKTSSLRIVEPVLSKNQILVAKPQFTANLVQPSVHGQIVLRAGESLVPVSGAVVVVSFNEQDVLPGYIPLGAFSTEAIKNTITNINFIKTSDSGKTGSIDATEMHKSSSNPLTIPSMLGGNNVSLPVLLQSSESSTGINFVNTSMQGDLINSLTNIPYMVRTDSTGNYYIGNLPLLKEGAKYTVKLMSVPSAYRDMEVSPGMEQDFKAVKGANEMRNFEIAPELFNLVGRVVGQDKKPIPYARAHFKGSSGYFETGPSGIFHTTYFAGNHTLVIEKEGFMPLEVSVKLQKGSTTQSQYNLNSNISVDKVANVKVVKPGEDVINMSNVLTFEQALRNTPTVQNAINQGDVFSPTMFGNAVGSTPLKSPVVTPNLSNQRGPYLTHKTFESYELQTLSSGFEFQLNSALKFNPNAFSGTDVTDLGDIGPMLPRIGKVRFLVVEKGSLTPIPSASIQLFDTIQTTNADGVWMYVGYGGTTTVSIKAPAGTPFVAIQKSVKIDETGQVTEVQIEMERGIRVSGMVSANGVAISDANIMVEGRNYLSAKTNNSGQYEIYIPEGEYEFRASKSGYLTQKKSDVFQYNDDKTLNFSLEDGGGKNISSLLGFAIELDRIVPFESGEKWSGRFVDVKGIAPIFDKNTPLVIPFTDVQVTFDNQGNAKPLHNEVVTDIKQLSLKAFGYLPLLIKSDSQIKVTTASNGKGKIAGQLQLDLTKIQKSVGFTFPTEHPIFLALESGSNRFEVDVIHADTNAEPGIRFRLAKQGSGDVKMGLYGFGLKLDLGSSFVGTDGLELVGEISTPALGPITAAQIKIEQFKISKELKIHAIRIQQNNFPSIKIANWTAAMTALTFNENGFKVGGKLTVAIPQSIPSTIDFANLAIGKDALFGGDFNFPDQGISVFKIATIKSGNKPLSFGRIGNTQVYYLSGSADMKFPKLLKDNIKIPSFQIQTDGRFMIEAPVNYSSDLGFAKYKIASLTLSTLTGQSPYISVQGEFSASFPGIKFEAADIRFAVNTAGDVGFSVGKIGGELSVPVIKVALSVGLKENGFEGEGKLAIPGFPMINAEVGFHYFTVNNGIDIGAKFAAGVSIPIGVVEITKVGGGFTYNSATKKFMVNINGAATITGMRAAVELNPISLTVESGPIITGNVGVVVGTALKLANATVTLNIPDKFFSVAVNTDIEPIKGVARARLNGLLKIKWVKEESYVFLGTNMDINVLGILQSYGEFAIGVNVKNPVNRGDEIAGYFRYLKGDIYDSPNSNFTGVYLHAMTEVGFPKSKAKGFDIGIASLKTWFHSTTDVLLLLNLAENDYRMKFGGAINAGAEGCAIGICVGGGFSACYVLQGGYNATNGWTLGGKIGGDIVIQLLKNAPCNKMKYCWKVIPCGVRICLGGHASVNVSKSGITSDFGLGKSNDGNLCF